MYGKLNANKIGIKLFQKFNSSSNNKNNNIIIIIISIPVHVDPSARAV